MKLLPFLRIIAGLSPIDAIRAGVNAIPSVTRVIGNKKMNAIIVITEKRLMLSSF